MDSITVLATVNTLSNMLGALDKTVSSTEELRRQWRDADLTILSLENQLSTLRTALGPIKEWIVQSSSSQFGFPELHHQLVMDLDRCIACCRLLITKIDADLARLRQTTGGDRPSKFTLMMRTRNLKKTQAMIQHQTTALTLLLTVCNSAAISQQKELLERPQTRRVFKEMEDDTSSLFVHRNVESIFTSSSSSMLSSTSTFGGASRLLLKFDFDKQLFMSKIYERWIRSSSEREHLEHHLEQRPEQQPEPSKQKMETPYVETREKFSVEPVETGEKFLADSNVFNMVETRDKFSLLPPVITGDKFIADGIADTPVETKEKFVTEEMAESPYSSITDDSTIVSSFGSLLSPTWTSDSSIKDKWKPLRLMSPTRDKSESQKRSLAIDSALKEEHRKKQRHAYRSLLIGSESRLHILTAAKMRVKKKAYTSQELSQYRDIIFKHLREFAHVLIKEMRRVQVNPQARYLWAYVDLIEGYYREDDEYSGAAMEPDERFFSALEAVLQDPLIADLVRRSSSSGQDGLWPRSAEYFFDSISRISSSDYLPTELDILYATTFSSMTRGADKAEVHEGDISLDLLDIGGLTGKRGKWIHQFEGARFVIFVVDLDQCYDAQKMSETMRLLDAVIHSRWFAGASIILLLNVNIADNGNGSRNVRKAAQYVLRKFEDLNLDRLFISPCDMTASGEPAIKLIFSAVKEAILTEALGEGKMLL